jgi:ATP/maltotriose-dependent transcriptional regulator MalT
MIVVGAGFGKESAALHTENPALAIPTPIAAARSRRVGGMVERDRLLALILERAESVVLIEAPAGMGKSVLLAQLGARLGLKVHRSAAAPEASEGKLLLWDIPPGARADALDEAFISGNRRIVIAKRPATELPSLARAAVYGRVFTIDSSDLLLTAEELNRGFSPKVAERLLARSAGWPMLVGATGDDQHLADFLATELLAPMPADELVALESWLSGGEAHPAQAALVAQFERVRAPLGTALQHVLAARVGDPTEARKIADAYARRGRLTEAILTYQGAGFYDEALEVFESASGRFFLYRHGPTAFDRVLAGFPRDYAAQKDSLVMSLAMQSLKRGEIARARRLIADRFGEAVNDLDTVFLDMKAYSTDFLAFRVVMLIYEDYLLTDDLFDHIFNILGDLAPDDHIIRGSVYNAILEFYIRGRRFAAAEELAVRALHHYEQAGTPVLAFYIVLHQALMRLLTGDAIMARQHARQADALLHQVDFKSPGDERVLALLYACIDYEGGKAEPLARFLSHELDDFAHGELWPSLVEFALQYGSQALSEHFSIIAARSFLDRWKVYQLSNRQFGMMIEMRDAIILQNANRWQEAAERLAALPSRITRQWVENSSDELARLKDRDEIMLVLVWLKHIVYETPKRPHLEQQLEAMLANLNMTGRQRIEVEVWLAFVHKRQRNLSRARALLQNVFENAARLGAIAPLAEERVFLSELLEHQRIGEFLDTSAPVRQVVRKLRDHGLPYSTLGAGSGLSRREVRVLLMISEGSSNKFIANALGLSEATVKFHLGNVYRKLGCTKRREAISAARALGLIE